MDSLAFNSVYCSFVEVTDPLCWGKKAKVDLKATKQIKAKRVIEMPSAESVDN